MHKKSTKLVKGCRQVRANLKKNKIKYNKINAEDNWINLKKTSRAQQIEQTKQMTRIILKL